MAARQFAWQYYGTWDNARVVTLDRFVVGAMHGEELFR